MATPYNKKPLKKVASRGGFLTMPGSTVQPQIKAANTYEALLVPALFRRWISKVADAAQVQHGQRALDIACGKVYLQGNPPHFFSA
jgi:hypothetical protein